MAKYVHTPVVFLATANSEVRGFSDLDHLVFEHNDLQELYEKAAHAGRCELVARYGVTLNDIAEVFLSDRYAGRIQIMHFAGHADAEMLLMQDEQGKALEAGAAGLAEFLAAQPELRLVFLNGCYTQAQIDALRAGGVRAVIATREQVDDGVAREFAVDFHHALSSGFSIEDAFGAAQGLKRAADFAVRVWDGGAWLLSGDEGARAWTLPRRSPAAAPSWRRPKPVRTNLPPAHEKLIGRKKQEAMALDELRQRDALVGFKGGIGMGKSALANVVAHACMNEGFFETCFWWTARYKRVSFEEFLCRLGSFLEGVDLEREDPCAGAYTPQGVRRLLEQRKTLLVVTKTTPKVHAKILKFLSETPPGVSVIVTSTEPIGDATVNITVESLSDEQAIEFVDVRVKQLGCSRSIDPERALALNHESGGSPVILSLAVGWLCSGYSFTELVAKLRSDKDNPLLPICEQVHRYLDADTRQAWRLICESPDQISGGELMQHLSIDNPDDLNQKILLRLRAWALLRETDEDNVADRQFAPANSALRRIFLALYLDTTLRRQDNAAMHRQQ